MKSAIIVSGILLTSLQAHGFGISRMREKLSNPGSSRSMTDAGQIPDRAFVDAAGRHHSPAELKGKAVSFCFMCGCERCLALAELWADSGLTFGVSTPQKTSVAIIVFAGSADEALAFDRESGLDNSNIITVSDKNGTLRSAYGVSSCPRVFVAGRGSRLLRLIKEPESGSNKDFAVTMAERTSEALESDRHVPAKRLGTAMRKIHRGPKSNLHRRKRIVRSHKLIANRPLYNNHTRE